MSNSEIDARNIQAHLVRQGRLFAGYAIFFLVMLGANAALYFEQQSNPGLMASDLETMRAFSISIGFLCIMVIVLALQAVRFSGLARKTQALLDKEKFDEVERDFRKFLPRRR